MSEKMWINKKGDKVHPDLIPIDDKLEDELVRSIIGRVETGERILQNFKQWVVKSIDEYMIMLRDQYNLDPMRKSKVGNVTLQSYDGLMKVQIAVQQHISFDKKLNLAKEKLDEYFTEKTEHADPEIRTLITKVFEVDKKGNVNAKMILGLKSYKISHPKWLEAMGIIDEAVEIVGSKSYIRFYKRRTIDDKWEMLSLDFAAM